jgi:putative ABC transport system substrate-binding protein
VQSAARAFGVKALILPAGSERNIDAAFASAVQQRANAVIVGADSLFVSRRDQLVGLAERHSMPAIYFLREFADIGSNDQSFLLAVHESALGAKRTLSEPRSQNRIYGYAPSF